jgi:hypothetical protein
MRWVDPTDPDVFAAVAGPDATAEAQPDVNRAVNAASEVLELATASLVHPAGTQVEEFIGPRHVKRFHLVYGPVTTVTGISTIDPATGDATPLDRPGGWSATRCRSSTRPASQPGSWPTWPGPCATLVGRHGLR